MSTVNRQVSRRKTGSPFKQLCQYYARHPMFPVEVVDIIVQMGYNHGSTRQNPIIIEDDTDDETFIPSDHEDFWDHLDEQVLEEYWNNIAQSNIYIPDLEDESEIVTWESELDEPGDLFIHWSNQ